MLAGDTRLIADPPEDERSGFWGDDPSPSSGAPPAPLARRSSASSACALAAAACWNSSSRASAAEAEPSGGAMRRGVSGSAERASQRAVGVVGGLSEAAAWLTLLALLRRVQLRAELLHARHSLLAAPLGTHVITTHASQDAKQVAQSQAPSPSVGRLGCNIWQQRSLRPHPSPSALASSARTPTSCSRKPAASSSSSSSSLGRSVAPTRLALKSLVGGGALPTSSTTACTTRAPSPSSRRWRGVHAGGSPSPACA
jgi:hypothetical protein